jgi:serpin B
MKTKKIIAALSGLCLAASMAASAGVQAKKIISYMPLAYYDINADGETDILDAIGLVKYLHGKSVPKLIDRADMDEDGQVDVFDLGLFLRLLVNEGVIEEQQAELVESEYTAKKLSAAFSAAENVSAQAVDPGEEVILGQTKFALQLLLETAKEQAGENVLVSPYSVSQALGMTANGAGGQTRSEMETVLGGSMETLNPFFYTMRVTAPDTEYAKLVTANSIWVRENYPVREDFLQTNADYYAADAYAAPFDQSTLNDINNWVSRKTDQMIPSILDEIPENAELYLVNAVAFDAKWTKPYEKAQIRDGKFTDADGKVQAVQMMSGEEYQYLSDKHASGFLKSYQGGKYAFAALLPEKGLTPEAYLETLTPESLHQMLAEPERAAVTTKMPEFSYDFDTLLNESLQTMGMPTAFGDDADFTAMTDSPEGLYISRVIHKTHIEVTPVGTRAGAATAVEMNEKGMPFFEETREVILDRPFVYMIVDTETCLPVFFGTVNSVS